MKLKLTFSNNMKHRTKSQIPNVTLNPLVTCPGVHIDKRNASVWCVRVCVSVPSFCYATVVYTDSHRM